MRPRNTLILVVHLGINIVVVVWIGIGIIVLLIGRQAGVRRLPPCHGVGDVRAVVTAVGLLLTVARCRLQDLRWVVPRGRVGCERRPRLLRIRRHRVLRRRLRSRRWLHPRSEMRWHSSHASVHGIHIIIGRLSLQSRRTVHAVGGRDGSTVLRSLRSWRSAVNRIVVLIVGASRTLTGQASSCCERCRSRRFRLFDSTGVMVLVSSQCSATSERLLTIGIRALVWSLARVNAPVPCERARITKRLQ